MTTANISRRNFLKGTGAATIGALAAGSAFSLLGCSDHSAIVGAPETWDYETDVVVVGFGGAGAVASIVAADEGSDVIVLEKYADDTPDMINHTPSSRLCNGACMFIEDVDDATECFFELSRGLTPKEVCNAWAKSIIDLREFWSSLGLEFEETKWDVCEFDVTGASTIGKANLNGNGALWFGTLKDQVKSRDDKITVLYETAGNRLIQNGETKEILGVSAIKPDGTVVNIKASQGVALCTGGFEHNEEMKKQFLKADPVYFYANPNNTGEGIKMGQAVGGDLWHMWNISARAVSMFDGWPNAKYVLYNTPFFLVNSYGNRWFYESKWPTHNAWAEFVNFNTRTGGYDAIPAYQIFDASTYAEGGTPYATLPVGYLENGDPYWPDAEFSEDMDFLVSEGYLWRADTIEDLAQQIIDNDSENAGRMSVENLANALSKFNSYCEAGVDEEFGRDVKTLVPLNTPPYYAVRLFPGGPNTQGGLRRNDKGQIIDPFGEPIERLYGAGEMGSVIGLLYPSGGSNVTECGSFGRIIGHELANLEPWE